MHNFSCDIILTWTNMYEPEILIESHTNLDSLQHIYHRATAVLSNAAEFIQNNKTVAITALAASVTVGAVAYLVGRQRINRDRKKELKKSTKLPKKISKLRKYSSDQQSNQDHLEASTASRANHKPKKQEQSEEDERTHSIRVKVYEQRRFVTDPEIKDNRLEIEDLIRETEDKQDKMFFQFYRDIAESSEANDY